MKPEALSLGEAAVALQLRWPLGGTGGPRWGWEDRGAEGRPPQADSAVQLQQDEVAAPRCSRPVKAVAGWLPQGPARNPERRPWLYAFRPAQMRYQFTLKSP